MGAAAAEVIMVTATGAVITGAGTMVVVIMGEVMVVTTVVTMMITFMQTMPSASKIRLSMGAEGEKGGSWAV